VIFKSYEIEPVKDGLLEITTDPAQVRVFKGEAKVQAGDNRATVKDGREVFGERWLLLTGESSNVTLAVGGSRMVVGDSDCSTCPDGRTRPTN